MTKNNSEQRSSRILGSTRDVLKPTLPPLESVPFDDILEFVNAACLMSEETEEQALIDKLPPDELIEIDHSILIVEAILSQYKIPSMTLIEDMAKK